MHAHAHSIAYTIYAETCNVKKHTVQAKQILHTPLTHDSQNRVKTKKNVLFYIIVCKIQINPSRKKQSKQLTCAFILPTHGCCAPTCDAGRSPLLVHTAVKCCANLTCFRLCSNAGKDFYVDFFLVT